MEVSTEQAALTPLTSRFSLALAGLQAGMIAGFWMLAWMGSSSVWQGRSFWTAENLLASIFYGGRAVRQGFGSSTVSGLATFVIVYSALGCLLAVCLKLPPLRLVLASIVVAVGWYYLSYYLLWKALSPLVPLLHPARPTMVGHVIYGAVVARFPRYVPHSVLPAALPAATVVSAE